MLDARSDAYVFAMKRPFKVVVSLVTLVAFLFNMVSYDLAWAARDSAGLPSVGSERAGGPGSNKSLNVDTFMLPAYLGTVQYTSSADHGSADTVVHIQDAHCNYEAQKKIAEIIEYLYKEYGITTVNLEGGAKGYDLTVFTDIGDKIVRQKVSDRFVQEGTVNGAEYFASNNPDKVELWGIEDPSLYLKNLNVYKDSLKHKDYVDKVFKSLGHILSNLKAHIYSKALLEFDMKYSQYKANNLSFKDYLNYLVAKAKELGIDVKSFTDIYLLSQALDTEALIDFKKADRERDALIDVLQKKLSKKSMEELVVNTVEFRSDRLSHKEFYIYIVDKAKAVGVDLSAFPELQKYIAYVSIYYAIDKARIMAELEILEDGVRGALCSNDAERELALLSKNLALLRNFFNISLTRGDYEYYKRNADSFAMSRFADFIRKEAPLYKIDARVDGGAANIDEYMTQMAQFYEYSFLRDDAFVRNMKFTEAAGGRAAKGRPKCTIMITGGFHTENLRGLFRERGISYIAVLPNFKTVEGTQTTYFKLLSGGVVGMEQTISAAMSSLAVASFLNELGMETDPKREELFRLGVIALESLYTDPTPKAFKLKDNRYVLFSLANGALDCRIVADLPEGEKVFLVEGTYDKNARDILLAFDRLMRPGRELPVVEVPEKELPKPPAFVPPAAQLPVTSAAEPRISEDSINQHADLLINNLTEGYYGDDGKPIRQENLILSGVIGDLEDILKSTDDMRIYLSDIKDPEDRKLVVERALEKANRNYLARKEEDVRTRISKSADPADLDRIIEFIKGELKYGFITKEAVERLEKLANTRKAELMAATAKPAVPAPAAPTALRSPTGIAPSGEVGPAAPTGGAMKPMGLPGKTLAAAQKALEKVKEAGREKLLGMKYEPVKGHGIPDAAEARVIRWKGLGVSAVHYQTGKTFFIVIDDDGILDPLVEEIIFHERREAYWERQYEFMQYLAKHTGIDSRRIPHIIAWGEEANRFSVEGGLTPYHKHELDKMVKDGDEQGLNDLLGEERVHHANILRLTLANADVFRYLPLVISLNYDAVVYDAVRTRLDDLKKAAPKELAPAEAPSAVDLAEVVAWRRGKPRDRVESLEKYMKAGGIKLTRPMFDAMIRLRESVRKGLNANPADIEDLIGAISPAQALMARRILDDTSAWQNEMKKKFLSDYKKDPLIDGIEEPADRLLSVLDRLAEKISNEGAGRVADDKLREHIKGAAAGVIILFTTAFNDKDANRNDDYYENLFAAGMKYYEDRVPKAVRISDVGRIPAKVAPFAIPAKGEEAVVSAIQKTPSREVLEAMRKLRPDLAPKEAGTVIIAATGLLQAVAPYISEGLPYIIGGLVIVAALVFGPRLYRAFIGRTIEARAPPAAPGAAVTAPQSRAAANWAPVIGGGVMGAGLLLLSSPILALFIGGAIAAAYFPLRYQATQARRIAGEKGIAAKPTDTFRDIIAKFGIAVGPLVWVHEAVHRLTAKLGVRPGSIIDEMLGYGIEYPLALPLLAVTLPIAAMNRTGMFSAVSETGLRLRPTSTIFGTTSHMNLAGAAFGFLRRALLPAAPAPAADRGHKMRVEGGRKGLWINGLDISDKTAFEKYKSAVVEQAVKSGQVTEAQGIRFVIDARSLDERSIDRIRDIVRRNIQSMLQEDRDRIISEQKARQGNLQPILVSVLDDSENLCEDHSANGFIGINSRLFGGRVNEETRAKMLSVGIAHQLAHEALAFERKALARWLRKSREEIDAMSADEIRSALTPGLLEAVESDLLELDIDEALKAGLAYPEALELVGAGVLPSGSEFLHGLRYHGSERLRSRVRKFLKEYNLENHLIDQTDPQFAGVYAEVRRVLDRLLVEAGLDPRFYRLYLSDESQPNAFYARGSNTFVINLGMLKLLSDDNTVKLTNDAVAFVLAHELTHLIQYMEDVESGRVDPNVEIKWDWGRVSEEQKKRYTNEYDADWRAVSLMSRAGFNVREAPVVFRALLALMKDKGDSYYLPLVGSHPELEPRTMALENLVLQRFWRNSAKEPARFSEGLAVPVSEFRDFQKRVYAISQPDDLVRLIDAAKDIKELTLAVSIGERKMGRISPLATMEILRAVKTKIDKMIREKAAPETQLLLYEELFRKYLYKSDIFSKRTIETRFEPDIFTKKPRERKIHVANPAEFDEFVRHSPTRDLIASIEGLSPTWANLENAEKADEEDFDNFIGTLTGGFVGWEIFDKGDYVEFIEAVLRELTRRIETGEESYDALFDFMSAIEMVGSTNVEMRIAISNIKLRTFSALIDVMAEMGAKDRNKYVLRLMGLLHNAKLLEDVSILHDKESAALQPMNGKIAKLLYAAYEDNALKDRVAELFRSHAGRYSPLKDEFFGLVANSQRTLDQKLDILKDLGNDPRSFMFSEIQEGLLDKLNEGKGFVDQVIEKIIKERPSLAGLRKTSELTKRVVSLLYVGGMNPDAEVLHRIYDPKTRKLRISAEDIDTLRNFVDSGLLVEDRSGLSGAVNALYGVGVVGFDPKTALTRFLRLFEFFMRKGMEDKMFEFMLYLDRYKAFAELGDSIDYLGVTFDTPAWEEYERGMRTFSIFVSEFTRYRGDSMLSIFDKMLGKEEPPANTLQGYTIDEMVKRLERQRPQRFARWDLSEDGDKDHLGFFAFAEAAYKGRSFKDSAAEIAKEFQPGFFRDMLIYTIFIKKVLKDGLGIDVPPDKLFDFAWLASRVNGRQDSIRDDIQVMLKHLSWDRAIQRMNAKYLQDVMGTAYELDAQDYEKERGAYQDILFYDIGGPESQLALSLAGLDEAYLKEFLTSAQPVGKKVDMVLRYYPHNSARRDMYVAMALDRALDDIRARKIALSADVRAGLRRALELMQNLSLQHSYAVRILEEDLKGIKSRKGSVSFDGELDAITTYLWDYSYVRDEVLEQFANRHARNDGQYGKIADLFIQNPDNIRKKEVTDYVFWNDQVQSMLLNLDAKEKAELLLWMMGLGKKPERLMSDEYRLQVSFDGLKRSFGTQTGEFYSGIGQKDQEEMLNSMIFGTKGIFTDKGGYAGFLDRIISDLIPADRDAVRGIFKSVLMTDDLSRRQRILLGLLQNYGELKDIKNPAEKEAASIRVFLEANGLIGVKLGQFLAHSVFVQAGSPLQRELEKLKDRAAPIDKGVVFDMLEKIYGKDAFERHFESIDEIIGSASIKVAYRARMKDGRVVVVKVKRPAVDKMVEKELAFLDTMLVELRPMLESAKVTVPAGLAARLRSIIMEELSFGNMEEMGQGEANNQRRLRRNIEAEARKTSKIDGVTYEIAVPVAAEVSENSLMVEEFAQGVPLKDEAGLRAIGVDPSIVREILFRELMQEFFFDGFYHADLHGGNVLVNKVGDKVYINLIDLGAAATISPTNRLILVDLFTALWNKDAWDSGKQSVYKYFPQIASNDLMAKELDALALSDADPMQKLMGLFALLEKNNIQFKDEYKEFYSVMRCLKASEYLFTPAMLEELKNRFMPKLDGVKADAGAIADRVSAEIGRIPSPKVDETADQGLEITVTTDTMAQAFESMKSIKEKSFWPMAAAACPYIDQFLDLLLAVFKRAVDRKEPLRMTLSAAEKRSYESVKEDVNLLMGLFRAGEIKTMALLQAYAAIRRIADKRDDLLNVLARSKLPVSEIIDYVKKVSDAKNAEKIKILLEKAAARIREAGPAAPAPAAPVEKPSADMAAPPAAPAPGEMTTGVLVKALKNMTLDELFNNLKTVRDPTNESLLLEKLDEVVSEKPFYDSGLMDAMTRLTDNLLSILAALEKEQSGKTGAELKDIQRQIKDRGLELLIQADIYKKLGRYLKSAGRLEDLAGLIKYLTTVLDNGAATNNMKAEVVSILSEFIKEGVPSIDALIAERLKAEGLGERLSYLAVLPHAGDKDYLRTLMSDKRADIRVRLYALGWYLSQFEISQDEYERLMREYGDEALELLKEISKDNSTVDGMFGNILLQDEVAKAYDMAVAIALHNKGRTGNKEGIVNAVEFRSIAGKIMKARLLGYSDKAKANFWIGWELLSAAKDRSRLFILTISHELMHNVLRELGISSDTFSKKVIHELLSDVYSLVMAELIEGKEAVAEFEKIMGYDEAVQAVAVNADHTTEGREGARAQLRYIKESLAASGRSMDWMAFALSALRAVTNAKGPEVPLADRIREILGAYVSEMQPGAVPSLVIRHKVATGMMPEAGGLLGFILAGPDAWMSWATILSRPAVDEILKGLRPPAPPAAPGIIKRALIAVFLAILALNPNLGATAERPEGPAGKAAPAAPEAKPQPYQFAQKYSPEDMLDPKKAEAFMQEYFKWEAGFFKIARVKGIMMDGWNLNEETLEAAQIRDWTAASKESLDIAVLIKILAGNKYGMQLTGQPDAKRARQAAIDILKEKIDGYEQFLQSFPAFGGFLPWITIKDGRITPTGDWKDRVPALDNGEWAWSLYTLYHVLEDMGEKELAKRYKDYFDILVKNAPAIFYDMGLRKIRAETRLADPAAQKVDKNNYSNNVRGYYLDDPYEGMMMIYLLTLFSDLPQEEKDHIWADIRMEKEDAKALGTVYKAWPPQAPLDGSPHIKWAFMFLPIADEPMAMKIYGIQEKIRPNINKYGIPVSTNTPGGTGYTQYEPNVFGIYGPFSMIWYHAAQGDVTRNNYGLAWLVNLLKADKMQGPLGSGESLSVKPGTNELDQINPIVTCDGKMTLWLAIMGGITNETREALKKDKVSYAEFMRRTNGLYKRVFGDVSLIKDNAKFQLPKKPIVGKYKPRIFEKTAATIDLSTLWNYHPDGDQWGDATLSMDGKKWKIKYDGAGGWGWGGGSLRGNGLTPAKGSAFYFKGTGKFKLKLEMKNKESVYIDVELKGEDAWTRVPLDEAVGNTYSVIIIDKVMKDSEGVVIAEGVYSPDGKPPAAPGAQLTLKFTERIASFLFGWVPVQWLQFALKQAVISILEAPLTLLANVFINWHPGTAADRLQRQKGLYGIIYPATIIATSVAGYLFFGDPNLAYILIATAWLSNAISHAAYNTFARAPLTLGAIPMSDLRERTAKQLADKYPDEVRRALTGDTKDGTVLIDSEIRNILNKAGIELFMEGLRTVKRAKEIVAAAPAVKEVSADIAAPAEPEAMAGFATGSVRAYAAFARWKADMMWEGRRGSTLLEVMSGSGALLGSGVLITAGLWQFVAVFLAGAVVGISVVLLYRTFFGQPPKARAPPAAGTCRITLPDGREIDKPLTEVQRDVLSKLTEVIKEVRDAGYAFNDKDVGFGGGFVRALWYGGYISNLDMFLPEGNAGTEIMKRLQERLEGTGLRIADLGRGRDLTILREPKDFTMNKAAVFLEAGADGAYYFRAEDPTGKAIGALEDKKLVLAGLDNTDEESMRRVAIAVILLSTIPGLEEGLDPKTGKFLKGVYARIYNRMIAWRGAKKSDSDIFEMLNTLSQYVNYKARSEKLVEIFGDKVRENLERLKKDFEYDKFEAYMSPIAEATAPGVVAAKLEALRSKAREPVYSEDAEEQSRLKAIVEMVEAGDDVPMLAPAVPAAKEVSADIAAPAPAEEEKGRVLSEAAIEEGWYPGERFANGAKVDEAVLGGRLEPIREGAHVRVSPNNDDKGRPVVQYPVVAPAVNILLGEIVEKWGEKLRQRGAGEFVYQAVISSATRDKERIRELASTEGIAASPRSTHGTGNAVDIWLGWFNKEAENLKNPDRELIRQHRDALLEVLEGLKREGRINLIYEYDNKVAHIALNPNYAVPVPAAAPAPLGPEQAKRVEGPAAPAATLPDYMGAGNTAIHFLLDDARAKLADPKTPAATVNAIRELLQKLVSDLKDAKANDESSVRIMDWWDDKVDELYGKRLYVTLKSDEDIARAIYDANALLAMAPPAGTIRIGKGRIIEPFPTEGGRVRDFGPPAVGEQQKASETTAGPVPWDIIIMASMNTRVMARGWDINPRIVNQLRLNNGFWLSRGPEKALGLVSRGVRYTTFEQDGLHPKPSAEISEGGLLSTSQLPYGGVGWAGENGIVFYFNRDKIRAAPPRYVNEIRERVGLATLFSDTDEVTVLGPISWDALDTAFFSRDRFEKNRERLSQLGLLDKVIVVETDGNTVRYYRGSSPDKVKVLPHDFSQVSHSAEFVWQWAVRSVITDVYKTVYRNQAIQGMTREARVLKSAEELSQKGQFTPEEIAGLLNEDVDIVIDILVDSHKFKTASVTWGESGKNVLHLERAGASDTLMSWSDISPTAVVAAPAPVPAAPAGLGETETLRFRPIDRPRLLAETRIRNADGASIPAFIVVERDGKYAVEDNKEFFDPTIPAETIQKYREILKDLVGKDRGLGAFLAIPANAAKFLDFLALSDLQFGISQALHERRAAGFDPAGFVKGYLDMARKGDAEALQGAMLYRKFTLEALRQTNPLSRQVLITDNIPAKIVPASQATPEDLKDPDVMIVADEGAQVIEWRPIPGKKGEYYPPEKLLMARWKGRTFLFYTSRSHTAKGVKVHQWRSADRAYDGFEKQSPENLDDLPAGFSLMLDMLLYGDKGPRVEMREFKEGEEEAQGKKLAEMDKGLTEGRYAGLPEARPAEAMPAVPGLTAAEWAAVMEFLATKKINKMYPFVKKAMIAAKRMVNAGVTEKEISAELKELEGKSTGETMDLMARPRLDLARVLLGVRLLNATTDEERVKGAELYTGMDEATQRSILAGLNEAARKWLNDFMAKLKKPAPPAPAKAEKRPAKAATRDTVTCYEGEVHVLIIKTGDEITLKAGDSYDTSAGILTAVVTWKSAGNALKGYEMKYVPVEGGKVRLMLSARGKKDTEGTMDITAFEAVREKLAGHARGSMNGALMPGAEIELFRKTFEELANSLKGRAVAPTVPTPLKTRMAINSEALAKVQPKDRVTKVVSMVADGQKPTLFNYISRILNKAGFGKGLAGLTAGAAGQHLVTIEESKAKADAENFIKMIEDAGAEDTSVDRIVAYVPPVKDGKGENIFEKVKRHFANNPRVIIVPDAYSDLNAAENKHPDLVTRIVFARDLDFYFKTGDSRILEAMKDLLNRISANGEAFLKIDKDGKLVGFTGSLEIKPIDYNSIRQWHDTTEAVLMSA